MGSHRDQTAPKAADKTATGKPNHATRPHAASRIEAAAMTTGENAARPWLAEIANANASGAVPRFAAVVPAAGRSGVSSANAVDADAPTPAIRPASAASRADPIQDRQRSAIATSRSVAPVLAANAATKAAPTTTSPGE